jgi:hypothetical protein
MIRMPRRSVTRFFIPLIDVLILLFCIFLLMPIVEEGAQGPGGAKLTAGEAQQLRSEIERQRQLLERQRQRIAELEQLKPSDSELQKEVARLRREASRSVTERLVVRTFQIDPKTGALVYYDPDRVIVRDQADALKLVDRDRNDPRIVGTNKELYYLIMAPRGRSLHPTDEEVERIERWFKGVQLAWDFPRRGPGGGKP